MNAHLRLARSDDRDKLCQLLELGLKPYGLNIDYEDTDRDLLDIDSSYFNNGGVFCVLDDGETSIGMYGLYKKSDTVCELRKMYLLPYYKGRGLGKLLMNDALERAINMGFQEMVLETNSCLTEAIGMYRRFGFEICELFDVATRCNTCMRRKL